jgi:hypothetical protein
MKRLSRLFSKAPPSPPTLQVRVATLNAGSADVILDAALNAEEEGLRVAAILMLPDGEPLRRLAGLSGKDEHAQASSAAALTRAAQTRLAQLIDAGSVDFTAFDPEQIARLVLESPSSRLRQMAAELVNDPARLKALILQVRNKDKSVYKILKQKIDALNAEDRKAEEISNEIIALCVSLERHSHRTYDAFYQAAFEGLKTRWQSLTTQPGADIEQRAQRAIEHCQEVIEAHRRLISQQAAEQAAEQAARQSALEMQERENQAAQAAAAAQSEAQARAREEAAAARDSEEKLRAQARAAEEETFRKIGGLIRMAHAAIRDGGTQRAAGLRRAIGERLQADLALPANLSRQIQQLDEKLNELKQWKDYAVAPKRLELIGEMEALIGSSDDPKALADRIKSLQQEWRTIGKGIASEAPEEWERFQRASQTAYQPCREYFAAQAILRQQNLDKRRVVLGRLRDFETAQHAAPPDWRLIDSVLRDAPREWRRHSPVDREAGRALQAEFDEALGRLQAKLDAWYEQNVADKQSLIQRARHLLTQEDSREAIDAVKRLQLSWKETGPAPNPLSQSLWNEFREVCDSVYQKRQQAFAEYNSGLEAGKLKAIALCEEVERAVALSGSALLEAVAKIPEWRAAYEALGEMPRTEARGLQNRFQRAIESCRALEAQQRARDARQAFTNLFEASRLIHAYQRALLRGADSSERETFKQVAESYIAGVPQWPKGGLKAIKEALASADSISDSGGEVREKALRILCIRGEIRSEVPSPPSDEVLRREYQVQRLVQGMGKGISADDWDWGAMALEWIRVGAVAPDLHESLHARFMRCWKGAP